ncbi:MAG TPA: nuclear transport factor 2 family protein [Acetobacteraceae bacterium]|nr:nuclear transport factor 2 family protein [Acetobacteraceae bacterium]
MTDYAAIADRYIAAWNETDAEARRALLAAAWTEGARYVDPLMQGEGRAQIDTLIGAVQTRFPRHAFTRTGTPDGHGDYLRFSWALGEENAPPVARGTDFAALDADGRILSVTGFLDEIAA